MKKSTIPRLVLDLAICAGICFLIPDVGHRTEFNRAFAEWEGNPTPATQAAFHAQQRKSLRIYLEIRACGTLLLFVVFNGLWGAVSAWKGYIREPLA